MLIIHHSVCQDVPQMVVFQVVCLYFRHIVILTTLFFIGRDEMDLKELLPGVRSENSTLLSEFKKEKEKKGKFYSPRTHHLDSNGWALFTNRLFLQKSPYLLQHAHNPVNWYPWDDEAFEEAQKKNRPVLLSVGYSTCHWCHVMEEESFEDLEIARYLNENYIAIKVDREERPDIDSVYMSAVQMITGRGGWPMTVWLTPQKQVFYGGTYFPPRAGDRGSSVGFLSLLKDLKTTYKEKKSEIIKVGKDINQALQKTLSPPYNSGNIPGTETFQTLFSQLKTRWDLIHGGIKGAPKFPSSFPSRLLLRSYLKTKDKEILQAVQSFLNGMLKGGLQDHVGGGFHRYSTDREWLIPHFEKMLYDQALLALVYLEAYQLLKEENYKDTAEGILNYVMRDMQSKEGGFYSATDADSLSIEPEQSLSIEPEQKDEKENVKDKLKNTKSEKETTGNSDSTSHQGQKQEGFYFTWTEREIERVLSKKQAQLIKNYYGMTSDGHFEGRNILHISKSLSEVAKELNISMTEAKTLLQSARKTLYQIRQLRPLPQRDKKILSSWNGLMISAFVYGYFILNNKSYLLQAEKSAQFILNKMYRKGRLYRSWKEGEPYIHAYLDDYVFFISALLDLFEWTGNIKWLNSAIKLDHVLEKSFEDKDKGGFFITGRDYEALLVREKPFYDGAEPSGNSIAVLNLLRLSKLTRDSSYKVRAEKTLKSFGSLLKQSPLSFSEALLALDYYHSRVNEIVLVLPDNVDLETNSFFNELKKWFLPNKILTLVYHSQVDKQKNLLPSVEGKKVMNEKTTIYICEEGACQLPALDLKELRKQLKEMQNSNYI